MFLSGKVRENTIKNLILILLLIVISSCSSSRKNIPLKNDYFFSESVPSDYLDQTGEASDNTVPASPFLSEQVNSEERILNKNITIDNETLENKIESSKDKKLRPDFFSTMDEEGLLDDPSYGNKQKYLKSGIIAADTEKMDGDVYLEQSDDFNIRTIENKTVSSFSMTYIPSSSYDVKSTGNRFNTIFSDRADVKKIGYLILSSSKYLYRNWIDFTWNFNLGASYNNAQSFFDDGTLSTTKFTVWFIPLDLGIGFGVPVSRYLKISANAGPSGMIVLQTRDDKDQDDPFKRRRQVGYGYYASGKFSINLSSIFESVGFNMYKSYHAGKFSFDIEMRMQNYDNFQDDYTISGTSLGAGFTFDFL